MTRIIYLFLALAIILLPPGLSHASQPDYAQDVQYRSADPSPNSSTSNINDYTYQDEQLNLDADAGNIRVLRTDQKVMLNDYVSAIIPLNNANPRELRGPIRTLVRKEGGEADVLQDKVNKQNYLQVTCPSFQMPYVQAAIQALDAEWVKERMDGSAELYYPAKFRDIGKVLNITKYYVSPEFVFRVDKTNNALFYRDEPALMGLQQWGLGQVDVPPSQMMLDVAVYEVDTNNNLLVGTDFVSWKNGPGRRMFEGAFGWAKEVIDIDNPLGKTHINNESGPFLYGSFQAVLLSSYVDFLRTKGKARLLNRGQVTAKSGSLGSLSAIDEVVTFRRSLSPSASSDRDLSVVPPPGVEVDDPSLPGYRARSLDYAKSGSVGVFVDVFPVIGQKSSEVEVSVNVSDVNGFTPAGTPIIESRSAVSKIRMYAGEPYVLAGLTRNSTVSSVGKVPILGSLPVIGWIFGHETESAAQKQVIVVLTPSVSLNAESVIEMPAEAKTAIAVVDSSDYPAVPETTFGFDQWLLDSE